MVTVAEAIRAVILDFDGTLSDGDPSWSILHEAFGSPRLSSIASSLYCSGKILYEEFMEIDLSLWPRPLHRSMIEQVLDRGIRLRKDAESSMDKLRRCGKQLFVVSSALDMAACKFSEKLGITDCIANSLEFDEYGFYTGRVKTLVEPMRKEVAAKELLSKHGLRLEDAAAIADSECDLSLLKSVRLGVMIGGCHQGRNAGGVACAKSLSEAVEIICDRPRG